MKEYPQPDLQEIPLHMLMQALADPCRLQILNQLLRAPLDSEFACNEFEIDLAKATISHHFQVLREAGLIRTRMDGTKCLSSLRATELEAHFPGILQVLQSQMHS